MSEVPGVWAIYDRSAMAYIYTWEGVGYVDSFEAAFKYPTREAAKASFASALKSVQDELLVTDVPVTSENIAKLVPYTSRASRLRKRLLKHANDLRMERDVLYVNDGPPEVMVPLDEAIESIIEAIQKIPRRLP